jgi:hypothetical protein
MLVRSQQLGVQAKTGPAARGLAASPTLAQWRYEHINSYGKYDFDVSPELVGQGKRSSPPGYTDHSSLLVRVTGNVLSPSFLQGGWALVSYCRKGHKSS